MPFAYWKSSLQYLYQYFHKFINSFRKICIPLKIHISYSHLSFKRTLITKRLSLKLNSSSSSDDTTYHDIKTYILFIKIKKLIYENTNQLHSSHFMENKLEFFARIFNILRSSWSNKTAKMRDNTVSARWRELRKRFSTIERVKPCPGVYRFQKCVTNSAIECICLIILYSSFPISFAHPVARNGLPDGRAEA